MTPAERVRLDLNNPEFQRAFLNLSKENLLATVSALRRIEQMTWTQVYSDAGLRWELIHSRLGPQGRRIYSVRLSKRMRAVAFRQDEWMRFLSIHPEHDPAYAR